MKTLTNFSKTFEIIEIQALLSISEDLKIILDFSLKGFLDKLFVPPLLPPKERLRTPDLWRETCFEFFISPDQSPGSPYLEFNLSPQGHWDLYLFDSYRQGMRPCAAKIISLHNMDQNWRVELQLQENLPWQPQYHNLSCVLKNTGGEISYWALSHPSAKPDFHDKSVWQRL